MIDQLVADAAAGLTAAESGAYQAGQLDAAAVRHAVQALDHIPAEAAYLLLLALRRDQPMAYAQVPAERRIPILAAALARVGSLNDFGTLGPDDAWDNIAGQALVEAARSAPRLLLPLLEDRRLAPLYGSETAALSDLYRYRRCDFAYRYLILALGEEPVFDAEPTARDTRIATLRARLST